MSVVSLSLAEIDFVSGGNAPGCADGFKVDSYKHDGSGNITEVTCVPTSTTDTVQEGAGFVGTLADIADTVMGWFS